ncbi:hypothetical protein MTR67_013558 [Solanum verrucosum]|uniref:Uncharacterized protein n=1 Tax=Solanum verrucosum TaxID=315347 RepID=A0AAF0QBP7_SOLVR|nr:hypothetical protein MTR67_013558 [Solanum verrucosum]
MGGSRSPIRWFEARDVKPLEVELVKDAQDKVRCIQAKLLAAQSRQKKYADHKVRDMEFQTEEEPIAILDRDVRKLRTKEIKSVKVQWKHRPVKEVTWEAEKDM